MFGREKLPLHIYAIFPLALDAGGRDLEAEKKVSKFIEENEAAYVFDSPVLTSRSDGTFALVAKGIERKHYKKSSEAQARHIIEMEAFKMEVAQRTLMPGGGIQT